MKTKILSLLKNTTESMSGQQICEKLGVSRTAVWKVINQLKEEGYVIEAAQNRGYKIVACPDIVTKSEIASRLTSKWAGQELYCYEEIESTNTEAKKKAEEGGVHGTLIVADKQNAGRGRRGRLWSSPSGEAIYMTILLRPSFLPDKASMLTLLMALAVRKAVYEISGLETLIKWPNDVIIKGKKICGILTEMSAELDYIQYVVVGAGINVNQKEMPDTIKEVATSILLESGKCCTRAAIIERVMYYFEQYYEQFVKTTDLSNVLEEYNSYLVNNGQAVRVLDPKGEFEATAQGINAQGELLVTGQDGVQTAIYAGEVSVRGVYGYV